ncbi:hypothetical protein TNCV_3626481 [Trichonephila clavipes]|nr:hypothetical protein TNCV_3626481 [Trichonephila clavipes]
MHGRWSLLVANGRILRNAQFFGKYNQKKLLTVEIIRISILLRLSLEGDEASPLGWLSCLKTSLGGSRTGLDLNIARQEVQKH